MNLLFPHLRSTSSTSTEVIAFDKTFNASSEDSIAIASDLDFSFDRAERTRNFCIASLCFAYLAGITAIVWSCFTERVTRRLTDVNDPGLDYTGTAKRNLFYIKITETSKELAALSVNVLVLLITECLGYIHATSLKWALFQEGKLDFNSNLRLFTFSRKSMPNNFLFNMVYLITLAICYASSPYFIMNMFLDPLSHPSAIITRAAPLCLGCGLLCQALICTWCLFGWIPTWSSNPMNTAAVVLSSRKQPVTLENCLSLLHEHAATVKGVPQHLRTKQYSASKTHKHVSWTLYAVLTCFAILLIWMFVLVFLCYVYPNFRHPWATFVRTVNGWVRRYEVDDWSFLPSAGGEVVIGNGHGTPHVIIPCFKPWASKFEVSEIQFFYIILFSTVLQIPVTVGTHCVELQVTLARDEKVWRTLSSKRGAALATNNLKSVLTNWQTVLLLIFKPVLHWVYGLVITADFEWGVFMFAPQAVYLCCVWTVFVAFALFVNFQRPRGPLPTTYGHIQSIIDLVDVWAPRMYWGDKGLVEGQEMVRRAGTAEKPLPEVQMEALYVL